MDTTEGILIFGFFDYDGASQFLFIDWGDPSSSAQLFHRRTVVPRMSCEQTNNNLRDTDCRLYYIT